MDAKNIEKLVKKAKDDILKEVHDRLPRKVGVIAVNHFKQNFRDGGWLDAGLHPWKKTKRQQQKGTDEKYGPLTSRRNHLMSSIQSKPGVGEVSIENPVPYASIHNDGGNITTHPTVSPKMKRFAWHMAYSLAGIKGKGPLPKELPQQAQFWRNLALTKKTKITINAHIPQRQFMGNSQELQAKVNKIIQESIQKIKKWNYFFIKSLTMLKSSCQISRSLMKTMVSLKISTKKIRICILSRSLQFSSTFKRLHGSGTMEAIKVFPLICSMIFGYYYTL